MRDFVRAFWTIEAVNLSFSFRTPSISWLNYLVLGSIICWIIRLFSMGLPVLTRSTPTPLKVALGIAGLATHGRNKLVQGATLSFVPFSQSPTGVLLLVFPRPDAQPLGTWLTACFHVPSGNRGKFAWTAQAGDFGRDSPNTTGWPPLVFQGLAPMDQRPKSWTTNNRQAKYRTPQMPSAGSHWFSNGSRSRSRETKRRRQVCKSGGEPLDSFRLSCGNRALS